MTRPVPRTAPPGPGAGSPLSRRGLLAAAAVAVPAAVLTNPVTASAATASTSSSAGHVPAVRGADISFTRQLEQAGVRWRAAGRTAPIEQILHRAGANWVRLRVWVDPPQGYIDADIALQLGRRAVRAGHKLLLDLHYSDFWADPGKQNPPAAWAGQDLTQLTDTVFGYTRDIVERFARHGAPIDMIQIGNEVVGGMLWPHGRLYPPGLPENFDGFTALVKAGIAGARSARGCRAPRTMLHLDRGGDNGATRYFFDKMVDRDVDFDVIGQSYYPFWHGTLAALEYNLTDSAQRYGKDIVVVETAYPWTLANGDTLENLIDSESELPDLTTWPPTVQGQYEYFRALREVFGRVPGGRGLGFMCWEPEWVPGVGWAPGEANPNDNLTLFDFDGEALPGLAAFSRRPMPAFSG